MKTLKEKWLDALPVIWGIISFIVLIYLVIWGFSKIMPTDEEVKQIQVNRVEQIKLCLDNNLDAYKVDNGDWYCKPKETELNP